MANSDDAFNKVDVVKNELLNSTTRVTKLERFVKIGIYNVGIYTFDSPIDGTLDKIKYIYHSNDAASTSISIEEDFGG